MLLDVFQRRAAATGVRTERQVEAQISVYIKKKRRWSIIRTRDAAVCWKDFKDIKSVYQCSVWKLNETESFRDGILKSCTLNKTQVVCTSLEVPRWITSGVFRPWDQILSFNTFKHILHCTARRILKHSVLIFKSFHSCWSSWTLWAVHPPSPLQRPNADHNPTAEPRYLSRERLSRKKRFWLQTNCAAKGPNYKNI